MASGGQDSDDELHPIRRSHHKRNNVLNSESESDSSSGSEIGQGRRAAMHKLCDSDSDISGNNLNNNISESENKSNQRGTDGLNDSSDGENVEKCSICLSKFAGQDLATPDICDHNFCSLCLEKWAKKMNTCPIDRLKFSKILVKRFGEPTYYKIISVTNKEPSTDDNDDDDEEEDEDNDDVYSTASHRLHIFIPSLFSRDCLPPTISLSDFRSRTEASEARGDDEDSSSSESSDENSGVVLRNIHLRMTCQEVRNRRRLRMLRNRAASSGLLSFGQDSTDGLFLTAGGRDGNCNCMYQSSISRYRNRPLLHAKHLAYRAAQTSSNMQRIIENSAASPVDILDDILALQTVLHTPGGSVQRDGSISRATADGVGQQCPLNPLQETAPKCNNATQPNSSFASSSSSSSGSVTSQCRDLCGVLGMLPGTTNTDGYDTDSCSMVTHRSYGSSSVPEELRRDGRETLPSADAAKAHSDEEVDIYSDIESTNEEETSMDVDAQSGNEVYESHDTHETPPPAPPAVVADGSDSSDNDLVIDEDLQGDEEEKNKLNLSNKSETIYDNSSDLGLNANENSNNSDLNGLSIFQASESLPMTQVMPPGTHSMDVSHHSNSNHSNSFEDSSDSTKKSPIESGQLSAESNDDSLENNGEENSSPKMVDTGQPHSPFTEENNQLQFNLQMAIPESCLSPSHDSVSSGDPKNEDSMDNSPNSQQMPIEDRASCLSEEFEVEKVEGDSAQDQDENKSLDTHLDFNSNLSVYSNNGNSVDADPIPNDFTPGKYHTKNMSAEELMVDSSNYEQNQTKLCPKTDSDCEAEETKTYEQNKEQEDDIADGTSQLMEEEEEQIASNTLNEESTKMLPEEMCETQPNEPCKSNSEEIPNAVDLGIEDISDIASDDLNQAEIGADVDNQIVKNHLPIDEDVERNVAQLFLVNSPLSKAEGNKRQSSSSDQEEGEIVEDIPNKRDNQELASQEEEEDMDSSQKGNISVLPRIPKIKRDNNKPSEPEDIPLEEKRTSVLGRVDQSVIDISWKRLSLHSRERSYRDGRPKDESLLFRGREPKHKEKKSKREREERHTSSERKDDTKKHNSDKKSKERSSRDRKGDKNQDKSSWQVEKSDKREKDKYGKSHDNSSSRRQDKYDRDQSKRSSERENHKKDRRDKHRSSRDDKGDRDKWGEEKYKRESDRYDNSSDRYERSHEKAKEKEHRHKHKDRESRDRKSETSKKSKDDKKKHSHSSDHYGDKSKEREVRKVDDKLKIVVEHKESKKDKNEKNSDKKYDKKHKDGSHLRHEKNKQEVIINPFSCVTPTPIESKEIFAKGDSIIINVNFNRVSSTVSESPSKFADENTHKEAEFVEDKNTPLSDEESVTAGETFWQEADASPNSQVEEDKSFSEKTSSDKEEEHLSDFDEDGLPETQPVQINEQFSELPSEAHMESAKDQNTESESFGSSKRRSPQPPSPPSPMDNDSYDPCEPTRSPSPPPTPPSTNPPLPNKSNLDHPRPPPSPELPPLPPGPEPTDSVSHEESRSNEINAMSMVGSPMLVQQTVASTQTPTIEANVTLPNVLMPPPSFPPRSSGANNHSQMLPPKPGGWQINQPPPTPMMFSQNHIHPVIRGNFLPSHIPTMGMPPQNATTTLLSATNSVPLMSQIRHLQLASHAVVPNVPLNLPPMPLSHMNHPVTSGIAVQHQMASFQSHPNSLPAPGVLRVVPLHNSQLTNIAVTISNQHATNLLPNQHFLTSQNQMSPTMPDKVLKSSPLKEKSEVVDMDVDSPYSPGGGGGGSPSVDSNYDYSPPPGSPAQSLVESQQAKDPFDSLLGAERTADNNNNSSRTPNKNSNKSRQPSTSSEMPRKKAKLDAKSDVSSGKSHHSIRLQVSDKIKLPKEQKVSNKKELFTKLDDTQLKILDELPSSAVEMQVKEKFLKKLNRQERVVEEVKLVLKPYYKNRDVNKDEYKDILRKCVPKICHNKSGDINPVKVKHLVESYVKKIKHLRKRTAKRHKT